MSLSTQTIFLKMQHTPMKTFIGNWVMFEELVYSIHATGKLEEEDRDLLGSLRYALTHHYEEWADVLRPYWIQIRVAGQSLRQDPFLDILETSIFTGGVSSYEAVQNMAVVRETFNRMLNDQSS
jgi:hypothetical protein